MASAREDWLGLLARLEHGEPVAIVRVSRMIHNWLSRHGAYEIRDSWADICQEVLEGLIKAQREGRIRDERAFVNYVGISTRNRMINWVKRHQGRPGAADAWGDPERSAALADPDPQTPRAQQPDVLLDLKRALESVPEPRRLALEAIYLEGLSYEEAAKRLGVPLGTLKRRQSQGLREMRAAMGVGVATP